MNASEIEMAIRQHTIKTGGHEKRNYLGMSQINRPEDELLQELISGTAEPSTVVRQRLALGYETEANIKARLLAAGLMVPRSDRTLQAEWSKWADGRYMFQGHTDGEIADGKRIGESSWLNCSLLEIKSTIDRKLDRIQNEGRIPPDHFAQVQCYMHFGDYNQAFVLYFARDTGRVLVKKIPYNAQTAINLSRKAERILNQYRTFLHPTN